jgi:transposase
VAAFNRNAWPRSIGLPGRNHRNPHESDTGNEILEALPTRCAGAAQSKIGIDYIDIGLTPPEFASTLSERILQPQASFAGLMQADAYTGFNRLYGAGRKPGPISEAACWAHARRQFFDPARLDKAPIAIEAVERIDALFAIEREINGLSPQERVRMRTERSRPLVIALERWLREQRAKLSRQNKVAKAVAYSLTRWVALTRFLDDGRVCMSNNAAERGIRPIAMGRKNWTFAGSDEGGRRAAAIYTLIETCKLNDVDPQAWLADVLARLQDHPAKRIADLLPWNWKRERQQKAAA